MSISASRKDRRMEDDLRPHRRANAHPPPGQSRRNPASVKGASRPRQKHGALLCQASVARPTPPSYRPANRLGWVLTRIERRSVPEKISSLHSKRSNNFDLLRIGAALVVVFSHSFPVVGRPEPTPFINPLGLAWGNLGVLVFFSISGYLVAQSWDSDPDLWRYGAKRLCESSRHWPWLHLRRRSSWARSSRPCRRPRIWPHRAPGFTARRLPSSSRQPRSGDL